MRIVYSFLLGMALAAAVGCFLALWAEKYARMALAAIAQHQHDILQIRVLLPGRHSYNRIETALAASGLKPNVLVGYLASNPAAAELDAFYAALR